MKRGFGGGNSFQKGPPSLTSGGAGGSFFSKNASNQPGVPEPSFPVLSFFYSKRDDIAVPCAKSLDLAHDQNLLKWMHSFENCMRDSLYFLEISKETKTIERYSDKYMPQKNQNSKLSKINAIETNVAFFPDELLTVYHPEYAAKVLKQQSVTKTVSTLNILDQIIDKLGGIDEENEKAADEENQPEVEEEEYNEEDFEEETDYNLSYFDPGDDYGDYDDGDGGDGPTF